MRWITWLYLRLFQKRIADAAREHDRAISLATLRASRAENIRVLNALAAEPGAKVCLGTTEWGQKVWVPLMEMVKPCGLTTGGMGSVTYGPQRLGHTVRVVAAAALSSHRRPRPP
jgi:hypothetical protein